MAARCLPNRCEWTTPLGHARRPAGEGQAHDVVVVDLGVHLGRGAGREQAGVAQVAGLRIVADRRDEARHVKRPDHIGIPVAEEQHLRISRAQQRLQLRPGQPVVQRHVRRAELQAGQDCLDVLGRVGGEQCYPVALAHPQSRQLADHLIDPQVDFGEGGRPLLGDETPPAGDVAGLDADPVCHPGAALHLTVPSRRTAECRSPGSGQSVIAGVDGEATCWVPVRQRPR